MTPAQQFRSVIPRVTAYFVIAFVTLILSAWFLSSLVGYLLTSILSVLTAACVANLTCLRLFEGAHLADAGLHWLPGSGRNLLLGIAGGIGAACLVLIGPLLTGAATLRPDPQHPGQPSSLLFLTFCLLLGAVGEELLFRGYPFQTLLRYTGPFAALLPTSFLFGWAHAHNLHSSTWSIVNTVLWGLLLGYAFLRSRDLWLPIGIHFGWNWTLPLFGVNLSGFTMGVTGFAIQWKVGELWSGGEYGPEAGLLTLVVLPLLGFYLLHAPIRRPDASLPPA